MPPPSDVLAAHWSPFVHLLVNVPRRFVFERSALTGIARQGTLAHVLFIIAAGRPRLSVPVASIPDFRRDSLMELLECGELLRCSSERGTACVSPVLLLDAVRQLPAPLSARLLAGDPVSSIWPGWAANAPAPRPLTEVASDVLAHAGGARDRISLVAKLQVIADDLGLSAIAAMARGAGATARLTGSSPALPALEPRVRPTVSS